MDRVGLFREMGYVTINDKYKERGGKQTVYHWDAHLHLKCSHTHIYIYHWSHARQLIFADLLFLIEKHTQFVLLHYQHY